MPRSPVEAGPGPRWRWSTRGGCGFRPGPTARSRYDYMVNVVKLQQAAGILSEQTLASLNRLLKDRLLE